MIGGKVRKVVGEEVEEINEEEIIEELRRIFWDVGGFVLTVQSEIPEYILLECGRRPGVRYTYVLDERIYTDGQLKLVAKKRYYNYPTQDDTVYKYKVLGANFIVKAHLYGDDYSGTFIFSEQQVEVYGNAPFLSKLKDLQKELEI